jgi:hypothetical protein
MHFRRQVRQGCEKVGENKTFGDKTLSIIQTNFIIKTVKDQKMPK